MPRASAGGKGSKAIQGVGNWIFENARIQKGRRHSWGLRRHLCESPGRLESKVQEEAGLEMCMVIITLNGLLFLSARGQRSNRD